MEDFPVNMNEYATTRAERYGATRKKNITITDSAHEQIAVWAEEHGTYFSVAIETLALIGLGNDEAALMPRLVENAVERVLRWQLNRLARILTIAAASATEANLKADTLLLHLIRQEAAEDPEHFVQNMAVSADPNDRLAARIRRMRDDVRSMTRHQAADQLRRPLAEIRQLLDGEVEVSDDGQ
jgi:hypothetical protein